MRGLRSQKTAGRAVTIPLKKMAKQAIDIGKVIYGREEIDRPKTRADCAMVPRPCPFVGCKYNLYLDVNPETGSIKMNFPDVEPWEMAESCALDIVEEAGELILEEVGDAMNVTRERIRQVEENLLNKLSLDEKLKEFSCDGGPGAEDNRKLSELRN